MLSRSRVAWAALSAASLSLAAWAIIPAGAAVNCPSISILVDATRLTLLKNGKIDLKAEMREAELGCSINGASAKSKLSFWVKSAISPASEISSRKIPYFVAIISNGRVIAKEVFELTLPFAGSDRKVLIKEKVDRIDIPIEKGRAAEDYAVTIGFQLTPEQAAYNRSAPN